MTIFGSRLLQLTHHFRLNSLQGYRGHITLPRGGNWMNNNWNRNSLNVLHISCVCIGMFLYEAMSRSLTIGAWSKIVLDQRQFGEKLLKQEIERSFTALALPTQIQGSEWKVACKRIAWERETWTLQSSEVISRKLLRRVHWPSRVPSDCLVSAAN